MCILCTTCCYLIFAIKCGNLSRWLNHAYTVSCLLWRFSWMVNRLDLLVESAYKACCSCKCGMVLRIHLPSLIVNPTWASRVHGIILASQSQTGKKMHHTHQCPLNLHCHLRGPWPSWHTKIASSPQHVHLE